MGTGRPCLFSRSTFYLPTAFRLFDARCPGLRNEKQSGGYGLDLALRLLYGVLPQHCDTVLCCAVLCCAIIRRKTCSSSWLLTFFRDHLLYAACPCPANQFSA